MPSLNKRKGGFGDGVAIALRRLVRRESDARLAYGFSGSTNETRESSPDLDVRDELVVRSRGYSHRYGWLHIAHSKGKRKKEMKMVTIRQATAQDQPQVFALLAQLLDQLIEVSVVNSQSCHALFHSLLESDRGAVLVAEEEGQLLGVITASFNPAIRYGGSYAQIEELVVDEAGRGKGIGARLVEAMIEEARQRQCKDIGLYALEHNRPFYEKLGFTYQGPELRQML